MIMMPSRPQSVLWEFMRFLMAGGFAALVNFISRILFNRIVGFSTAIILAYLVGMITGFILFKILVFKPGKHHTAEEVAFFILINIAAVAQTWIISMVLYHLVLPRLDITSYAKASAHFVGIAVPAITSYAGHKYLTFKQ